jgi:hypothetical protein
VLLLIIVSEPNFNAKKLKNIGTSVQKNNKNAQNDESGFQKIFEREKASRAGE